MSDHELEAQERGLCNSIREENLLQGKADE